jgi:hypothetical protein
MATPPVYQKMLETSSFYEKFPVSPEMAMKSPASMDILTAFLEKIYRGDLYQCRLADLTETLLEEARKQPRFSEDDQYRFAASAIAQLLDRIFTEAETQPLKNIMLISLNDLLSAVRALHHNTLAAPFPVIAHSEPINFDAKEWPALAKRLYAQFEESIHKNNIVPCLFSIYALTGDSSTTPMEIHNIQTGLCHQTLSLAVPYQASASPEQMALFLYAPTLFDLFDWASFVEEDLSDRPLPKAEDKCCECSIS